MQRAEAHVYFLETIGMGDWFWGTTLNDVRYCVEGEGVFMADASAVPLPQKVVLHFPTCKGGDVVEGYGIYNYLRGLAAQGVQVETRVEGLCASIAVLCALAADTVLMAEAALWMVHKPSSCGSGNADELRAEADVLDKIQAQIVSRYVARTGGKLDAATANELINKESWLNADECIAYGFATGKLPEDPIAVPEGADAVLNYFPTNKTAPMATLTPAEKKGFFDELKTELKDFFNGFKNEAAPVAEPVATNAATSFPATDDSGAAITLYSADAELAVDSAVFTDDALSVAAADGNYTLEDGREVTVLAGAISEMEATDEAAPAATNTADLDAANATILELQGKLATATNQVKSLKAKVAKHVPGSTGSPTPAGAAQNFTPKNAAGAKSAPGAFQIRKH